MNGAGSRGFTLIELLVVIAIIAILAGLLLPALGKEITFDGETGAVRQVQASADADWLMKVNLLMAVLHFGHLGGDLMKWLWLGFGLAPVLLVGSGLVIWRRRSRSQAGLPGRTDPLQG